MKYLKYLCMLLLLTACYEPLDETEKNNKDKEKAGKSCQLQISVFSSSTITYPVNLLIFDNEGNRLKDRTLTEDIRTMSISLDWGNYRIVALSGTSYYQLPNSFTLESVITLSNQSLPLQALYMGEADITLSSETARANLQLLPQTAEIWIEGKGLSSLTQQVKVQVSSLYTQVNLQASYEEPKSFAISCEKNNNTWQAGPFHLFPAQGTNTIVTMEVIRTDSTLNYGYILPYPLQAGYRYELKPSPSGLVANDIVVDPSVANGTAKEDTLLLNALPTVPGIWDGHIVAYQERSDDNEADLWLMSINEWESVHSANSSTNSTEASDIANSYQEGGTISGRISQWHIPTKEEAYALRSLYAGDRISLLNNILSNNYLPVWSLTDDKGENLRYLCNDGFHTFSLASSSTSITKGGTKATYRLRLLKKIHVSLRDER